MTPRPDDVPAAVVEELEGFGGVVLDMDEMMRRFRGAIAHPAFAPWFLRQLAQREPSGEYDVIPGKEGYYVERVDGFGYGPIEGRDFATILAHLRNALAAPTPPRGAEEGR